MEKYYKPTPQESTVTERSPRKFGRIAKKTGVAAMSMLAAVTALNIHDQQPADALSVGCKWYGVCAARLTKTESKTAVGLGAAAAGKIGGVPGVVLGGAGGALGADAIDRGNCLQLNWTAPNPMINWTSTYRC